MARKKNNFSESEDILDTSKDVEDVLSALDDMNPYVCYLTNSTLSNVTDWIDTGSKMLNGIISGDINKGVPKGRITMLAGPSGCGKSLMCMKIAANAQKKGLSVIYFDSENSIDANMARRLGADPNKIKYCPAKSIEEVRNYIFKFLDLIIEKEKERAQKLKEAKKRGVEDAESKYENKLFGKFVIIIDSIANLLSEQEISRMESDKASADMGSISKAIKSLLKMSTTYGAQTNTTFVITNHIYENPGQMYPDIVKNMSGGHPCKYLPSVTVQFSINKKKAEDVSGEKDTAALSKGYSGIEMRFMCVKNRFLRQMVEGSVFLSWTSGFDEEYGMIDLAKELGVISNSGATYSLYDGTKIGFAKNFRQDKALWENTIYPEINKRLTKAWGLSEKEIQAIEEEESLAEEEE